MKRVLAALFVFLAAPAWAQEPAALSLREALCLADRGNAELSAGRERYLQAAERYLQARSYFFPSVSIEASAGRRLVNPETFGAISSSALASSDPRPFDVYDARARITQTLFDVPMIRRFEAAAAGRELSRADEARLRQDVLAMTGTLYFQAARAKSRIDFAKENLRLAAATDRIVRRRLDLGTASEVQARAAAADLSAARQSWRAARESRASALADLCVALGFSPGRSLSLADDRVGGALPKGADVSRIAADHPAVETARAAEKKDAAIEEAERASYWPSVEGSADYGPNGTDLDDTRDTYSFGVKAVWDVFDLGRRPARVAEAAAKKREASARLDSAMREREARIYDARGRLKSARRYLRAKADARLYREALLRSAKANWESGLSSRLDVLAASASLWRARDEEEDARSLCRLAEISLMHAQGTLGRLLEKKNEE